MKHEIKEETETWYSTTHVAGIFGVTTETVRNWIDRGVLKGERRGNHWWVPRTDMLRLANERHGPQ